jgi:hypothetical protein
MKNFKNIDGFGKYKISKDGKVYSKISNKILKSRTNKYGYLMHNLISDSLKVKTISVHRLVALNYLENPNNYKEVNHIDGDKKNNVISNLEWCNRKQNINHAIKMGLLNVGEKNPNNKLKIETVKIIRDLYSKNKKIYQISNILNIKYSTVYSIVNKKTWNCI